jgi:hypothetical protein
MHAIERTYILNLIDKGEGVEQERSRERAAVERSRPRFEFVL